jgi:cyclic pyranopterin phosphate synthase
MGELSHFDDQGASRMVDVSAKPVTERTARASCTVTMAPTTAQRIRDKSMAKGDVLEVARLAGIMAAKKTGDLIPLCHPLPLTGITVDFTFVDDVALRIASCVKTVDRTGVEMEALTAVAVAALTVYDMVKSIDRGVVISNVHLDEKTGGVRGDFRRDN